MSNGTEDPNSNELYRQQCCKLRKREIDSFGHSINGVHANPICYMECLGTPCSWSVLMHIDIIKFAHNIITMDIT